MSIFNVIVALLKSLILGVVILLGSLGAHITATSTPMPQQATSTISFPAAPQAATSSPPKPVSKPLASTPAPAVTPPGEVPNSGPGIDPDLLNTQTRAALVNILCTTAAGGYLQPISGSGVVIDSRGVILTNAHVGQFFLLKDYGTKDNVQCVVRTGSPAQPSYYAKLLYLPQSWVEANAQELKAPEPMGTGEHDYALLLIVGTVSGNPTPASLSALAMSTRAPDAGQEMLLAAYPAGFLSGQIIASQLFASSAFAYATQLFAYSDTSHVDLFSIGGSIESQAGSSGGAVVRLDGTLAGIIATATLAQSTGQRDLRAITVDYINRDLIAAGKGGLSSLLSGDLSVKADDFNKNVAPGETAALEAALNSK